MSQLRLNKRGNAVIIAIVAGALSLAGLVVVMSQVSQFAQQAGQGEKAALLSNQNSATVFYLQKKFEFGKTLVPASENTPEFIQYGAPDWYPEFYPTPSELQATPRIIPIQPFGQNLPASNVPLFMVTKTKNSNGDCKRLDFPGPKKQINPSEDCEFISLSPDKSSLGAIQNQSDLSKTDNYLLGLLGVPDLNLLNPTQKDALFKSGFVYPLENNRAEPIKFVKYMINESNPRAFSEIVVQTNSVGAIIPVEIPPPPKCQLSLDSSVRQPLKLDTDKVVKFNLEVERGIADTVSINLANHRETTFDFSQFDRQRLNNFERPTRLRADGFSIHILASDKDAINNYSASADKNSRIWRVEATVTGLDGTNQTCSALISIEAPLSPVCTVAVNDPTILKNNFTDVEVNCDNPQSGPVSSATLDGVPLKTTVTKIRDRFTSVQKRVNTEPCLRRNRAGVCTRFTIKTVTEQVKITETYSEETTDLSLATSPVFLGKYKRKSDSNETLRVIATGPGGSRTFEGQVGDVCPYNNATFSRKEFSAGALFSDNDRSERDRVERTIGELIFRRKAIFYQDKTTKNYLRGGESLTWNANNKDLGNRDTAEKCEGINFCMILTHVDHLGSAIKNSKAYWVEVGSNDSGMLKADFEPEKKRLENINQDLFNRLKVGQLIRGTGIPPGTVISELEPEKGVVRISNKPIGSGSQRRLDFLGFGKRDPQCRVINTKMRHGGCFAGSTRIKMADGTERTVATIGENDWLWNPHYKAPVRVKKVVKGPEAKALFEVKYQNQRVVVTEDHPFLTQSGWLQAQELKVGAKIIGAGSGLEVKSVRKLSYKKPEDVWNFELDTNDSMGHMVLANGIPTGDLVTQQLLKKDKRNLP